MDFNIEHQQQNVQNVPAKNTLQTKKKEIRKK